MRSMHRVTTVLSMALACALASGCVALGIGAAGGAAAGGVETAKAEDRGKNYGVGTYTATVLSNVVYVPAKAIYAGGGALTSGVAYLVSGGDRKVSGPIWQASTGGDYVVTPAMIAGRDRVDFSG